MLANTCGALWEDLLRQRLFPALAMAGAPGSARRARRDG
jgi:hypothetical protein